MPATTDDSKPVHYLRRADLDDRYGHKREDGTRSLADSSLYFWMHHRGFPRPVKIGFTNLWVEAEIDAWDRDLRAVRDSGAQPKKPMPRDQKTAGKPRRAA
jgi:hypothetical protein